MSVALNAAYQAERRRLTSLVVAAAATAWTGSFRDRAEALERALPIVAAGQAQTVTLVDAYLTAKAASEGHRARRPPLDPSRYTVEELRGRPAREVYERPFGAYGAHLAAGASLKVALTSGQASVSRLVRTDLQLSQTHAARDWMAEVSDIVGYRRVLGPGKNCELCAAASTRRYRKEHLLPIHEHCGCWVEPIFGTDPVDDGPPAGVRFVHDPELGLRLVLAP